MPITEQRRTNRALSRSQSHMEAMIPNWNRLFQARTGSTPERGEHADHELDPIRRLQEEMEEIIEWIKVLKP